MWKEKFRGVFGDAVRAEPENPRVFLRAQDSSGKVTRHSNGFEQFFTLLQGNDTLSILDLAGVSQANISFITNLGHRLSSEDLVAVLDQCFGDGDFFANQQAASRVQRFTDQTLQFGDSQFDGVLVWDTLQFLAPPLREQVVERLLALMRPGGLLLAFFHADEKNLTRPACNYRILDAKTLQLAPRGPARSVQYFNNRTIERLFERAKSVKFFLTRDHLREVIVRK